MCETRNANRSSRSEDGEGEEESAPRRRPRRQANRKVRPRGSGPRGGSEMTNGSLHAEHASRRSQNA